MSVLRPFEFIRTKADLDRYIVLGQTLESELLDFKACVNFGDKTEEKIRSAAADIVAFANNLGGNLVIGLTEKSNENGVRAAGAYIGIQDVEKYRVLYDSTLRSWIHPSSIEYYTNYISYSENIQVLTVNVFPIVNHLGAVYKSGIRELIYPIRTSYGNRFLSPVEIEERMNVEGRTKKVEIMKNWNGNQLTVKIHSKIDTSNPTSTFRDRNSGAVYISELRDDDFLLSFNGVYVESIPYSFVTEFWRIGRDLFGLCLKCRLYLRDSPRGVEIIFD
jgi:hypothetical protein